jgi:hypothetical protein
MNPAKWDVWRFTWYGTAVGILYGMYFGLPQVGAGAGWDPRTFVGMGIGVVGGAAAGAIIAAARNLLVRLSRS